MSKALKNGLLILGGVLLILLIYGIAIEPYQLVVEEETASLPSLPSAWNGQVIAAMGDLQVGMWLDNVSTVRQAVEVIIERDPAAVLLLGDYVYHSLPDPGKEIGKLQDLLRPLQDAGIPTFAVLGDHDYGKHFNEGQTSEELADRIASAMEEVGTVVLRNEASPLSLPGQTVEQNGDLYLVGIGPENPGHANSELALSDVPADAARIVFFHNPDIFRMLPASTAPLAVSGHTHGGQIRFPLTPDWNLLDHLVKGEFHAEGWFYEYGATGNQLYVNRGIGFSLLPIRINAPPELTFFTLRGSEQR